MAIKIVPTQTWYLEMTGRPVKDAFELPPGYSIEPFTISNRKSTGEEMNDSTGSMKKSYLETYKAVGGNYNWYDRLLMPVEELEEVLNSANTEILYLKYEGEIAGFVEFDHSAEGETEIVYFGLTASHTGRKAGLPFLQWAINHAWQKPINRLWLHTCDLDHPAALPLYQKAGFSVYKSEIVMQRVESRE